MQKIIVATDFSEVAHNAVQYACSLAQDFDAAVTIVHSFIVPVAFSDTPMPLMPVDEAKQIAEERVQKMLEDLRHGFPDLQVDTRILYGSIVDCLEEMVEKEQPWMVVLGNSGADNNALWLGSNVLTALKTMKCTVMAVPSGVTYRRPAHLCFACDFKNIADHLQTENLMHLVRSTSAKLHVLNVDFQNKNYDSEMMLESTELHAALKPLDPVYHYVEQEDVEEGIESFVAANQMDWLIIVPHKHSFFERLFHKSHTREIMKVVTVPLVALHER